MRAVGGTEGYTEDAARLVRVYESVSFADLHGDLLPMLPPPPARAVDIGAGSGRDAAALARMGHAVTAVEPVARLREWARRAHGGLGIVWVDDALPELGSVRGTFDLVLLSAVWMHLDEGERAAGMARVAALTAPGGTVVLTLRHGPVPEGRRMFQVPAEEVIGTAAAHGLRAVQVRRTADLGRRPGVCWTRLVLRR